MDRPKAYSYTRFSTPDQARGDSLRRQVEAAEAYAAARGLVLDELLTDAGLSAFHGTHREKGAFGTFLAAVEAGKIARGSTLIVESLDRLSRADVLTAYDQLSVLIRAGVTVVTLADGQSYSRETITADWTKLMLSLLVMSRAHEESLRKSERIRAAWVQKRVRARTAGEAMTGECVGWCRPVGTGRERRYELVPERAAIVRRLFEEAASGMGRRMSARRLNAEGVAAWGHGDGWHDSYVAKILESRAALGFFQPHKKEGRRRIPDGPEIANYFPAAVPADLFWRAASARRERRGHGGRRGKGVANILSRLAFCASCGGTLHYLDKGPPPKGGRYLTCSNALRRLPCATPARWRYEEAETAVLRGLRRLDVAAMLGRDDPRADLEAQAVARRAELQAAEGKRDRLLAALGDVVDAAVVAHLRTAAADVDRLAVVAKVAEAEAAQATSSHRDLPDRLALLAELDEAQANAADPTAIRTRLAQEVRRLVLRLRFTPKNILADYHVRRDAGPFDRTVGVPLLQSADDAAEHAREAETLLAVEASRGTGTRHQGGRLGRKTHSTRQR